MTTGDNMIVVTGIGTAVPASRGFVKLLQSPAAAASSIERYDATSLEKLSVHGWFAMRNSYCNAT
jgi:hypothetical protein